MINKQAIFHVAVLTLTAIFAFPLFATTPSITGVSGTVQNGQVITISGQYLMDEDKTNWFTPFKSGTTYGFEGSSYTADGYDIAPDEMVHGTRGYDTNVKLSGNKSIYGNVTYAGKTGAGFNYEFGSSRTEIYARMYSRWNSTGSWVWPESYIKNLYALGNYSEGLYLQPSNVVSGKALPTTMNMHYNSAPHEYSVNNFLQNNRWYCIEARMKTSSPPNFSAWVDGVLLASVTPSASGTMERLEFGMINMCCQGSGFNLTNWVDNFVVSTSRVYCSSIVEIGNSSNYETATKVYQAPVYLSDNSVQVTVDLTGLGDGPYYLWVTNNKQERSSAYALSGGGNNPPSPPFGLRVVE